MIVCVCNAVSDREIRHAVELGCDSIGMLREELGVSACCGKCRKQACRVIKEHKAELRGMQGAFAPGD
jgi:bacterioferritin-associated ferredoxin